MKYLLTTKKEGLGATWQDDFPETTKCIHCKGKAYFIFTYYEGMPVEKKEKFICNTPPKDLKKKDLWFHDCCAIANYACVKCLEVTALNNQA